MYARRVYRADGEEEEKEPRSVLLFWVLGVLKRNVLQGFDFKLKGDFGLFGFVPVCPKSHLERASVCLTRYMHGTHMRGKHRCCQHQHHLQPGCGIIGLHTHMNIPVYVGSTKTVSTNIENWICPHTHGNIFELFFSFKYLYFVSVCFRTLHVIYVFCIVCIL